MNASDPVVTCSACGAKLPRSEMFGVEPELHCPSCAAGVRKRMHVRFRPLKKDRSPYVTVFCLVASVGLFIATDFIFHPRSDRPTPRWLLALYQDFPIWRGEVWRHLTCMFLHGGWWHILLNGFALWFLGRAIEFGWGRLVLAGLMVGTGATASAVEWIMQGGGVGLSGGLFGLCGFLWALRRVHPVAASVMSEQMIRWILTLLVLGVILSATGRLGVGNWAHGGGLVSGYLIGMAARARPRRRPLWLSACALGVILLVVLSIFVAFGKMGSTDIPRGEFRKAWIERYGD